MTKLYELLGHRHYKGDVGVEIECEGAGMRVADSAYWRTEQDGSLRGVFPEGAAEFVMKSPVAIAALETALDELIAIQKKATFDFSFRTSVHVHVNVQALTEKEMLAFLYLCMLVEHPLMNYCGESRIGNRFCLRYMDAEGYDKPLEKLFETGYHAIPRLDGNRIRYSAINIHSLKKYGSIEFRGMRGNMDKDVLIPWCETLVNLREYAQKMGSPVEVYNTFISTPNDKFLREALGKHHEVFLYEDATRDLDTSFSLTIDLPHIYKHRPVVIEAAPAPTMKWVAAPAPRREVEDNIPDPVKTSAIRQLLRMFTDKRFKAFIARTAVPEKRKIDYYLQIHRAAADKGVMQGWEFLLDDVEGDEE